MTQKIPPNSKIADIVNKLGDCELFLANVRHLLIRAERDSGHVVVRIGTLGSGQYPNFRIETANGKFLQSYDGRTFVPFGDMKSHIENWSSEINTIQEVTDLLAKKRNLT